MDNVKKEVRCMIAMPCNRGVKPRTVESIVRMVAFSKLPIMIEIATEGYTIAENRITLASKAIKNGCTHLLFVDDDMIFPEDTLLRLLAHKKEVIGILYHPRQLGSFYNVGFLPGTIVSKEEDLPETLFECYGVGTGTMLVDLEVFNKIEKPWFDFETYEFGMMRVGEDFWFCRQCTNKGIKIWCDPTLKGGHVGDFIF